MVAQDKDSDAEAGQRTSNGEHYEVAQRAASELMIHPTQLKSGLPAQDQPVAESMQNHGMHSEGDELAVTSHQSKIDKSALVIAEPRRIRDPEHLKFVAEQPCIICGRQPCEAHHLRYVQPRALGRKSSDAYTVPLCALHHRELHSKGNERTRWVGKGRDPLPTADQLWRESINKGSGRIGNHQAI